MAFFMVMDFETPGDNLFTRNFAELARVLMKAFGMGLFENEPQRKKKWCCLFCRNIVIKSFEMY